MNKKLEEFCRKYDARVGESHRMYRRIDKLETMYFQETDIKSPHIAYKNVKCVEIHLPEDRFRALVEHDDWVAKAGLHDNRHFANNVNRVSNMVLAHERECRIRQENPAVQKAYEQYQILYRMVESNYG
jgi:hypothetical protein